MDAIVDSISQFIKDLLAGWVMSNLEGMFTDVNDKVDTISGEVSLTPATWNSRAQERKAKRSSPMK